MAAAAAESINAVQPLACLSENERDMVRDFRDQQSSSQDLTVSLGELMDFPMDTLQATAGSTASLLFTIENTRLVRVTISDNGADGFRGLHKFGAANPLNPMHKNDARHSSNDNSSYFGVGMKRAINFIGCNQVIFTRCTDHNDGEIFYRLSRNLRESLRDVTHAWQTDIIDAKAFTQATSQKTGTMIVISDIRHSDNIPRGKTALEVLAKCRRDLSTTFSRGLKLADTLNNSFRFNVEDENGSILHFSGPLIPFPLPTQNPNHFNPVVRMKCHIFDTPLKDVVESVMDRQDKVSEPLCFVETLGEINENYGWYPRTSADRPAKKDTYYFFSGKVFEKVACSVYGECIARVRDHPELMAHYTFMANFTSVFNPLRSIGAKTPFLDINGRITSEDREEMEYKPDAMLYLFHRQRLLSHDTIGATCLDKRIQQTLDTHDYMELICSNFLVLNELTLTKLTSQKEMSGRRSGQASRYNDFRRAVFRQFPRGKKSLQVALVRSSGQACSRQDKAEITSAVFDRLKDVYSIFDSWETNFQRIKDCRYSIPVPPTVQDAPLEEAAAAAAVDTRPQKRKAAATQPDQPRKRSPDNSESRKCSEKQQTGHCECACMPLF